MQQVKRLSLLATAIVAMVGSHANAAMIGYEGDFLPTDPSNVPQWSQLYNDAGSTGTVAGGVLTIATPAGQEHAYRQFGAPGGWEPTAAGSTVDVGLKVIDQAPNSGRAGDIFISTASRAWLIRWGTIVLHEELDGGSYLMDTTDTFHNYRFSIAGANGPLAMYVDGAATPAMSWVGIPYGGGPRIDFGDTQGGDGGTIAWDYIRWTNGEVPEPASLSCIGLAIALLVRRR